MDYKDTLNLPKTDFPMKANLPKRELEILEKWRDLYKKLLKETEGREVFLLHDGPPYANGNIHIGHALNKILKDIINKYNLLSGKRVVYIPGWDCHGLPIERNVEKELGKKKVRKEDIPKVEFRRLCREYAKKFVDIQKKEFMRLGVLGDWDSPYLTMNPSYQAAEVRELGRVFQKGLAFRSKKPVYWCIYDKTAEAEAEVEYAERKDPSIYVKFPVKGEENVYLVVWTTTPWTLPANLGIMVGEDFDYVFLSTEKGTLVVAEELAESFTETVGLKGEVIKRVKGSELVGLEYVHPFVHKEELKGFLSEGSLGRIWRVYPSEFVELGTGTGLVHMAPGHGQEDYTVGKRNGIEPYSPLDDSGRFVEPASEFIRGMRVFDANKVIIESLEREGYLLHKGDIKHSYPHCWRCKNPVIFRATTQWFIGMERKVNSETLRAKALEEIDRVKWVPSYGKNRIKSMVENRPDWCISRQRYWGVPIAVFYCKDCGEIVSDNSIFEHVASLIQDNEFGADIWFERSAEELVPEGTKCPKCGGSEFEKEEDILDVWFDSGVSHACVLKPRGFNVADVYLEGSDQHRGWFQSSLLESVASYGYAPYKEVITHGFTVDEKGRKMSKSVGNVVAPQEIIEQFGADIIRLWVVSEDYTEDMKLGSGIIRRVVEDYKKVRNTFRFFLGNLYDFNPSSDIVSFSEMHHFDRWIISLLQRVLSEIHKHYRSYHFHRVNQTVRNFCIVELSSVYLDVLKDRLYVYSPDSWERRSAQSSLYILAKSLTPAISPYLSFTAEEIWQHLRNIDPELSETVFLSEIPEPDSSLIDEELEKDYGYLLKLRDEVMKAIEVAKSEGVLKHPYQAKVYISGYEPPVNKYKDYLNYFLTVSQVELSSGGDVHLRAEELGNLEVGVSHAEGKKCPRCWVFFKEEEFVGDVCFRCSEAMGS